MSVLSVKDLRKSYNGTEVLKGVGFSLEKGEVLAIIGSSGGGKTTLLRCLNFLELADKGTIAVNDEVIYDGSLPHNEELIRHNRVHFGLVFQSFNLFPQYSVLENVTLAPKLLKKGSDEEIEEQARVNLAKVNLSHRLNSYPYMLSGGESQRVAIARALSMTPDILCFDEPTSALDPELTREVLSVIRDLKQQGQTMVVVTHEMEFAKNVADKIIYISGGIIEEYGDANELFSNPKSPKLRDFLSNSIE